MTDCGRTGCTPGPGAAPAALATAQQAPQEGQDPLCARPHARHWEPRPRPPPRAQSLPGRPDLHAASRADFVLMGLGEERWRKGVFKVPRALAACPSPRVPSRTPQGCFPWPPPQQPAPQTLPPLTDWLSQHLTTCHLGWNLQAGRALGLCLHTVGPTQHLRNECQLTLLGSHQLPWGPTSYDHTKQPHRRAALGEGTAPRPA